MKDFGNKDFGQFLKSFFGEAKSSKTKALPPLGGETKGDDFQKFTAKSTVKSADELDSMESDIGTMLNDFEKAWENTKNVLRTEISTVMTALQAHKAANTDGRRDNAFTKDDAEIAQFGGTKAQFLDKFKRRDAAPDERGMQGTKINTLSKKDIDQGASDVNADNITGGGKHQDVLDGLQAGKLQGLRARRYRQTKDFKVAQAAQRAAQTGGENV